MSYKHTFISILIVILCGEYYDVHFINETTKGLTRTETEF